jgi:ribosome biogenesis protein ENP2
VAVIGRKVVSADTRIVKIWDASDGKPFTSIEPQGVGDINDVCLWPDSGEPPFAHADFK